jgi:hypothetical protein
MTPEDSSQLTVDDIRHHAEEVRDLAQSEARQFAEEHGSKAVAVGVIAVVVIASIAYYVGTRAGRRGFVPVEL